jgi:hypothetical protein
MTTLINFCLASIGLLIFMIVIMLCYVAGRLFIDLVKDMWGKP